MSAPERWQRVVVPGLVGLVAGVGLTALLPLTAQGPATGPEAFTPHAPPGFKAERPVHRGLDANLYMQTAAEYRACCYQAYNLATRRLKELQTAAENKDKKLAVVMDLDETVLNNAGFQAMLVRSRLAYDQRLWDLWEEKYADQVGLVPGAREFILETERLGVAVFYISNRSEKFRDATANTLKRLRIAARAPSQLKLMTTTGDKTARRKEVEAEYTVLLYFGDNLRDFDEQFRCPVDNTRSEPQTTDPAKLAAAIEERKDKVDQTRPKWGSEWIILPNPAYGEWMKPLGLGEKDEDRLVPVIPPKR